MRNIKEPREDDDLQDTDTNMEHGPQSIEKDLEEPETDERYQIENPTKSNMSKIQEPRGDEDIVDTDAEPEHVPVHDTKEVEISININIPTVIADNRQDREVNDENIDYIAAVDSQI